MTAKALILRLVFLFVLFVVSLPLCAQHAANADSAANSGSRRERKQMKKSAGKVVPAPDLSDPAFIDYTPATLFLTPVDSLDANAYVRRNFTDQFISLWEFPGRVYPASRIFGIRQGGSYYRACRMDAKNSVFGELVVKGRMSLYYARKLPQEAGLIEFVTSDAHSSGYRNFMIVQYEDRARFESDYHYFITLEDDSLNAVPVKDFEEFATRFLKDSPEARKQMMRFAANRKGFVKVAAPLVAAAVIATTLLSSSMQAGLLVSAPFIAGGMAYAVWRKKKGLAKPDPDDMAGIVRTYNITFE